MKNIATTLFVFLFVWACNTKQEADYLVFSGQITHPVSDTVKLTNFARTWQRSIPLATDSTFSDTLRLTAGYYYLEYGDEYTGLYLAPGQDVKINLDTKAFDESLHYEGPGAAANNYLAAKSLLEEKSVYKIYTEDILNYDEKGFLNLVDSITNAKLALLDQYRPRLSDDFIWQEEQSIHYEKLSLLPAYENNKSYILQDTAFQVSDNFPDPYAGINLHEGRLAALPAYLSYLEDYLSSEMAKNWDGQGDIALAFLHNINTTIVNDTIKDALLAYLTPDFLDFSQQTDSAYHLLRSLLKDERALAKLEERYQRFQALAPGNPSPGFAFVSLQGDTVRLADLRGKPVYIDVWATWCGPCIDEIPHLKKLEKDIGTENIRFVSICLQDQYDNWQRYVRENELGGLHLFAPKWDHPFFRAYNISGIPHFILLDAEGLIINANAKRPSDPQLKEQLQKLVKKI